MKNYYNLPNIIKNDFLMHSKIHLILLFAIIISANSIVITVQNTRLLISEEEELMLIKKKKDNEWRNLILEKNTLIDYYSQN